MFTCSKQNKVAGPLCGLQRNFSSAPLIRLTSRTARFSWLLGALLFLGTLSTPEPASAAVISGQSSLLLQWDRSLEADVTAYRVYFGPASRNYTNSILVGNVTSSLIAGLSNGTSYYFAVTAIDTTGLESEYSNEAVGLAGGARLLVRITPNRQAVLTLNAAGGQTFELLATTNLTTWTLLSSVIVGTNGLASYTDTAAPGFRARYYKARKTP